MEENRLRRIMPHNLDAEKSVISAMLTDSECIVTAMETLVKEDFYNKHLGLIFQAIVDIYKRNIEVDLVILAEELADKKIDDDKTTIEVLQELAVFDINVHNLYHYAKIVKDKSTLRKLIRINGEISDKCYTEQDELDDILNYTEKELLSIINSKVSGEFEDIQQIVARVFANIEHASKTNEHITGIASGFIDLDNMTTGFQNSDLILIAARPSMGKTAFVLNILSHVSIKKKLSCLFFSLEMNKEQLVNRMLSLETKIDSSKLKKGKLDLDEWQVLMNGAGDLAETKMVIDDTSASTLNDIRSKCRKVMIKQGLDLVIIDYLQLMNYSGKKTDNRQQEISEISRGLKSLAREMNIPIIALSQLSRSPETRKDHRPMLSDLRESGAIEQDADIVMFLYRDSYYDKNSSNLDAEVIIAKQRNGPTGTVFLGWDANTTKFYNKEIEYN